MSAELVRVLLIEDNPLDADLIKVFLRKTDGRFDVHRSDQMSGALEQIATTTWDVILADIGLPDCPPREVVTTIREAAPDVPVVVLTGVDSDAFAMHALEQGAQDYLVKDGLTSDMLARSLHYAIARRQNVEMRRLVTQLRNSEQLLAANNRRLSQLYKTAHEFVDNVSHEFRTPLTVIKEYAALVSEGLLGPLNQEQVRMLGIVGDRADDLNTMVDDMLDSSRIEAGMLSVYRKEADVAAIIEYLRPDLKRKAEIKDVKLDIALDANLPPVYCDAEKVRRVIVNLVVNAIKFCGQPGQVRLWAKEDRSSPDVVIGVTDNGPGIDHEIVDSIFTRFHQLGSNPRGSTKGFGLGLSIAKELVDLNFGQMNVETQVGRGSTFSFTVPLAQPAEVMRRYLRRHQRAGDGLKFVSLVVARIDESLDSEVVDEVDSFLNHFLRCTDFMIQADAHRWLFVWPTATGNLDEIFDRFTRDRDEMDRNRPLGPLPDIALVTEGTWPAADHLDEILAYANDVFHHQQPVLPRRVTTSISEVDA